MRSSRWIGLLSFLVLPALAQAYPYPVPPPPPVYRPVPVGAVPPHVYVRERIRWHFHRRPRVVVVQPRAQFYVAPGPQVYVPPPEPPVYVAPQPPVPPQPYYPPSCCVQPQPPVAYPRLVKPPFKPRVGIGVTGEGIFGLHNSDARGWGILGQLRYRAVPHLTLEFMGGYERTRNSQSLLRTDVPVTFGLLVPLAGPRSVLSPYFVFAGGLNFASLHVTEASPSFEERRIQAIGQIGFGLELRLGSHVALNGDARLEGRWNLNGQSTPTNTATNGPPAQLISNSLGLRVGGGLTIYF
ncbi:MAG TPA: hypothetical protein VH877_15945 [Polyangia bacterium]|jgi:hypothetical protein|nr:hypothetical protein [Polyangia bacterium]